MDFGRIKIKKWPVCGGAIPFEFALLSRRGSRADDAHDSWINDIPDVEPLSFRAQPIVRMVVVARSETEEGAVNGDYHSDQGVLLFAASVWHQKRNQVVAEPFSRRFSHRIPPLGICLFAKRCG
jgi:hypothetical protein